MSKLRHVAAPRRPSVRLPRKRSLKSIFDYLKRAYPAEPQPVEGVGEAVSHLADLGYWCVWKDPKWLLVCRMCMRDFVHSGNAANHACSSDRLGAARFELAKRALPPLEDASIPEPMSCDLPEAETSFEHRTKAADRQAASDPELTALDARLPVEVEAPERMGRSE